MIPEQRRAKIIEKLQEKDICAINTLIEELQVSRITIIRDIDLLFRKGVVDKLHGGVRLKKDLEINIESRFSLRVNQNYGKKLEIAKKTLKFVKDASTIFLDSSSTVYLFSRELFKEKFLDLRIITTSPAIICDSLELTDIRIICTGGELKTEFNMFAGDWVIEFLNNVNINSAYISAAGITRDGVITYNNQELANTINKVIEKSDEINILVDSSKFLKTGMLDVSNIELCNRIITDKGIENFKTIDLQKFRNFEIIY